MLENISCVENGVLGIHKKTSGFLFKMYSKEDLVAHTGNAITEIQNSYTTVLHLAVI